MVGGVFLRSTYQNIVCSVNSNGIKLLLFGSFCPHSLCFRDKLIRFWVYCCAFVDFYSRLLLSGEICTFAHVTSDFFCNKQSNKRG